jgi:hypothetical protein
VDSVPNQLLLSKSGSAGNRTGTSGSVARNSGHGVLVFYITTLYVSRLHSVKDTMINEAGAVGGMKSGRHV